MSGTVSGILPEAITSDDGVFQPNTAATKLTSISDSDSGTYLTNGLNTDGRISVRFAAPTGVPSGALLSRLRVTAGGATVDITGSPPLSTWQQANGVDTEADAQISATFFGGTAVTTRLDLVRLEVEYDEQPTVSITGPTGTITDSQASVEWTFSDDLRAQEAFQVVVTDDATGDVVYDSGKTYNASARGVTVPPLPNGDYTAEVTVWQQFQVDFPSEPDTQSFTINATVPAAPTLSITTDSDTASAVATITDSGATGETADLQHRVDGGDWVDVASEVELTSGTVDITDRWAPLAVPVEWRARVAYTSTGLRYVGEWSTVVEDTISSEVWWAKVGPSADESLDQTLGVVEMQPDRPQPGGVFRPLDGSAAIAVDGPVQGIEGTLVVECWSSDEFDALDDLFQSRARVLIQDEQGKQWWTSWRSWSATSRIPGSDVRYVTIEFAEVAAPDGLD